MKWEYKIASVQHNRIKPNGDHKAREFYAEDDLNELGEDGWELVSFTPMDQSYAKAVFKRPKP